MLRFFLFLFSLFGAPPGSITPDAGGGNDPNG